MGRIKLKNYNNISLRHRRRLLNKNTKSNLVVGNNSKNDSLGNPEENPISVIVNRFHSQCSQNTHNTVCKTATFDSNVTSAASHSNENLCEYVDVGDEYCSGPILHNTEHIAFKNTETVVSVDPPRDTPHVHNDSSIQLQEQLANWALIFNVNLNAVSALLHIINNFTTYSLPKDARTLLQTPRHTIVKSMGRGQYLHLGLENALKKMINQQVQHNNEIDLLINIDGLPISRSSTACLWPILCSDNVTKQVFMVGSYYGHEKPTDVALYLQQFVDEAILLVQNGYCLNNKIYKVNISALICDAPAKSFALCIKGHTGYNSCSKCKIEGQYINNRICFPFGSGGSNILRKSEDFWQDGDEEFQYDKSPFLNIPNFNPVLNVPLDYLHLICLGVVKKLILLWMSGKPLNIRIPGMTINKISSDILKCQKTVPREIVRKPRSLSDIHHWKGTEFRSFLLYVGPVVLKKYLSADMYLNFLTLHTAIRILCNPNISEDNNYIVYAENLLIHFVQSFGIIYGNDKISHNVHNLIHIADDAKKFGSLDNFSAFRLY
ncbi:uncharacterized protein LOC116174854 isoform X1 [Photinus pyralis]|uniref:uncharacterized protein LOC116174854 isoform X1 n=1 Tax=Photinus pyralis TaxID=7054 RepID=UPI00126715A8|nr:uncharacterized protein LOC116174854 isoform X1 [Photinus pyralis]